MPAAFAFGQALRLTHNLHSSCPRRLPPPSSCPPVGYAVVTTAFAHLSDSSIALSAFNPYTDRQASTVTAESGYLLAVTDPINALAPPVVHPILRDVDLAELQVMCGLSSVIWCGLLWRAQPVF